MQGLFDSLSEPMATGKVYAKIGAPRKQREEAVILLASILESELTISYEAACVGRPLTKFNGEAVLNLRALAAAVHGAAHARFLTFEFDERRAVLETAQSRKAEADVLRDNGIVSWCSADVDPRGGGVLMGCITAFLPGGGGAAKRAAATGAEKLPPDGKLPPLAPVVVSAE